MTYPSGWPDTLPRPSNLKFPRRNGCSDWFEIYSLNPETFAFLEPYHDEETISFLILGSEKAVLLDTGMGAADILAEVRAITSLPVTVVNSHHHYDHVGGNYLFNEVWLGDSDYGVNALRQGRSRETVSHVFVPGRYTRLPAGFDPSTYRIPPSRVTRRLKHLDLIDLGDRVLEVHATPGHSLSDICLYDRKYRFLFTGDTYYPGSMFASDEDADFPRYIRSLSYLCSLLDRVEAVCPAHNEILLPKSRLPEVLQAFEKVQAGGLPYEQGPKGEMIYGFDGFRLILSQAALKEG